MAIAQKPYNTRKRWELTDMRHAYLTWRDPKLTDVDKAQVFKNLGRTMGAVATMVSAVDVAARGGRSTSSNLDGHQLAYVQGRADSPKAPRPTPAPEEVAEAAPEADGTVAGQVAEVKRQVALVEFRFNEDAVALLTEVASQATNAANLLARVAEALDRIEGQLETQTQALTDLGVAALGRVDIFGRGRRVAEVKRQ
jgi:hypothetical protein